jgi:ubiquinone/menaquinone biosynthesis C-methylase UbiE
MTATELLLIVLAGIVAYWVLLRLIARFWHAPVSPLVGPFLDSGFRRRMQSPQKLIQRSGIKQGMTVLELGSGSGGFTTFAARTVGQEGRVYAVDIQPGMLAQLQGKLARSENRDIENVEVRRASAYDLPFEDESFDLAYMVTVLPEIPDRSRALREVRRRLKPGGILAVTEFLPDPDYPLRSTTIRMCQNEGFVVDASSGNLWNYTVRFRKL